MGILGPALILMSAGVAHPQTSGIPIPEPAAAFAVRPATAQNTVSPAVDRRNDPGYQLEKVKEWRTVAAQHSAGKPDPAAMAIGAWQTRDLEIVMDYVTNLASQSNRAVKRALSKARIQRLFDLTDQEAQQGDLSRILRRGVLLHTDIALLDLEKWEYQHLREGMGAFADGHTLLQPKKHHWEFARRLVDCMPPFTAQNMLTKQWYVATTAHMESHRLLGYAGQNLKRALEKYPEDDRILFYAGVLHEAWASPVNQNVVLPKGGKTSYGSRESELKLARQFFQKTVTVNPAFAEARLRLGRVLGLLGIHDRAARELQQAAQSIQDPQLLYYASLFLGRQFETLSRRSEARGQYERAAMLYPTAQAPLLALSQLAHSGGDTEGALLAAQRVFALPREDFWNDDPLWIYDVAHIRDETTLVEELRKMLEGGVP